MMTTGEDMAEFMGEQNGEQSESEGQSGGEGHWMLVEKFKGVEEFAANLQTESPVFSHAKRFQT